MTSKAPKPDRTFQTPTFFLDRKAALPSLKTIAATLKSPLPLNLDLSHNIYEADADAKSANAALSTPESTLDPTDFLSWSGIIHAFASELVPARKTLIMSPSLLRFSRFGRAFLLSVIVD